MEQSRKMAFLGFGDLSEQTRAIIEEATRKRAQFEVVGAFDDLRKAAAAITSVEGKKVVADGNVLYVHEHQPDEIVDAARRLGQAGASVQAGWTSFDPDFVDDADAVFSWLGTNTFPAKPDPLDLLLFGAAPQVEAAVEPAELKEVDPVAELLAGGSESANEPAAEADAAGAPAAADTTEAAEPERATSFVLPPAKEAEATPAPTRRNPLLPGASAATPATEEKGEAFLARGPELAKASGPSPAAAVTATSPAGSHRPAAPVAFELPPAVVVPVTQMDAPAYDEVINPDAPSRSAASFPQVGKPQREGAAFFVTGSHGGSGKTTITWSSANTTAASFKRAGRLTPVYLVETDFGNPKLGNRLSIPTENTTMAYVKYLKWLDENKDVADEAYKSRLEAKAIETATWTDPETGLRVIAAPYDTRVGTSERVQEAILALARKLLLDDVVVFFDSGTSGRVDDNALDRELADLSDFVLIATSAGVRNAEGKWVNGSIDDMLRMGVTFATSRDKNGWGLPREKIFAFYNKTDYDSFEERRDTAWPFKVCGYMPYEESMDRKWVGDMHDDPAYDRAVIHIARAVHQIKNFPELEALANAPVPELVTTAPEKKRGLFGFRK